jgi:hypothetical protein
MIKNLTANGKNKDFIIQKQEIEIEKLELKIKKFEACVKIEICEKSTKYIEEIVSKKLEKSSEIIINTDDPIIEDVTDKEEYKLSPLELGEGFIIEHREEDGYINIINLCNASGKKFNEWYKLVRTKTFIKALSSSSVMSVKDLIKTETNGNTWVHPQIAINIAQWISSYLDVKVSAWVYEVMMSGKIDITNTKSYRQLQQENKNKNLRIKLLENKVLKKHKRVQYKETYVVYIITTSRLKKIIYIFSGKRKI